jgi:hypothetical protein
VIVAIESHQGAFDMQVTTIGLDIAKNVFQVHGIDAAEKVVVRKQLRPSQVLEFFKARCRALSAWRPAAQPTIGRVNSRRSADAPTHAADQCFAGALGRVAFLPARRLGSSRAMLARMIGISWPGR